MGSTSESTFQWREESPSVWARSLDRTELHYVGMRNAYARHGREWGMLSTILKLDTDMSSSQLVDASMSAWKGARRQHPILASTLDSNDTRRLYKVADAEELASWIEETFIVHDGQGDTKSAAEAFRRVMKPAPRATLHVFPATQEMLLQTPHHVSDGLSILQLVNSLLDAIADPKQVEAKFGAEAERLSSAPSVIAKYAPATAEDSAVCQSEIGNWIAGFPSSGIGASNVDNAPGDTRAQRMVLSQESTDAVLAAAKRQGLTATHVVEAALIVSSREIEKRIMNIAEDRNYVSCGLFSLRSRCDASAQGEMVPCVTFFPQVIKPGPFLETARAVRAYYDGWKARGEQMSALIEPTLTAFAAMSAGSSQPNQMLSVSSFGRFEPRLESRHGPVRLVDFQFVYETPDAGVSASSWTREGRLTVSISYNEAYHKEETIREWVQLAQEKLLTGLGISK
ncbi:hypothetical protein PGQ11_012553 [Apiospora arundinis]|uniref:Condensation domain-containing protein n=1 Tax=Apiospora arundinis TaxID=335852 RepID=A0ABR2I2T6_9PEZI